MATETTAPPRVPATAAPTAILFATALADDGRPAASLTWEDHTLVERLSEQLRSLGIDDIRVITRDDSPDAAADLRHVAAVAREGDGPLILAGGEIITQREALAGLLADPRVQTGILTTSGKIARPYGYRTKTKRGRLISASSPFHTTADPNQTFLGVLKVAAADRPRLAVLAERLAALRAAPPESWTRELDVIKAGTWKLAADRITRQLAEREARLAAEARGETTDPEGAFEAATESDPDSNFDPETSGDPIEIERQDPSSVVLEPADAAELARRMAAAREEVPALLLTALVRDGALVGNSFLRSLFWARPLSAEAVDRARERIVDYDEEAELLRSAVKASDGFFTTFLVSPFSKYVARACARAGLSPNQVTIFSMALGILAAALFATGERPGLIAGGVVAYFAFFFDCVDGQLARYARRFSKLGAWLDSIFDRSKEYVIFAGLALGAHHMGYASAWSLACAAVTLQIARHSLDFSYPAAFHARIATLGHAPLETPGDGFGLNTPLWLRPPPIPRDLRPPSERPGVGAQIWRLWRRLGRKRRVFWMKKVLTFPIGERFAVIAIVTAVATPKTTLTVLLVWGGIAVTYLTFGRLLRVVRSQQDAGPSAALRGRLESYRDDGPLVWPPLRQITPFLATAASAIPLLIAIALGVDSKVAVAAVVVWAVVAGSQPSGVVHSDRFSWLVPPMLRLIEFSSVTWMSSVGGHTEAGFAFLAAVCFRHYDLVYRLRHRGTESERLLSTLGLGWAGRMLLVLVLLLAQAMPAGLYVAAGALASIWVGDAVRAWTARPAQATVAMTDDELEEEAG